MSPDTIGLCSAGRSSFHIDLCNLKVGGTPDAGSAYYTLLCGRFPVRLRPSGEINGIAQRVLHAGKQTGIINLCLHIIRNMEHVRDFVMS